jgi:hypothetical protein
MILKDIKKIMKNNPSVFQILKTDSVYIPSKMQFELIQLDTALGIYQVIDSINFNQYIKLNLALNYKMHNKNSLYTQSFYKLIKE